MNARLRECLAAVHDALLAAALADHLQGVSGQDVLDRFRVRIAWGLALGFATTDHPELEPYVRRAVEGLPEELRFNLFFLPEPQNRSGPGSHHPSSQPR